MMKALATVFVLLVASLLSPAHPGQGSAAPSTPSESVGELLPPPAPARSPRNGGPVNDARVRLLAARTRASRHRRSLQAADRAVERELLRLAPRTRLLARFVDRDTGLVKRNVAARCRRIQLGGRRRALLFVCRIWQQPRRPSSGVTALYRVRHHRVVVKAYRPRRKS